MVDGTMQAGLDAGKKLTLPARSSIAAEAKDIRYLIRDADLVSSYKRPTGAG
jgi:hypothetical protein